MKDQFTWMLAHRRSIHQTLIHIRTSDTQLFIPLTTTMNEGYMLIIIYRFPKKEHRLSRAVEIIFIVDWQYGCLCDHQRNAVRRVLYVGPTRSGSIPSRCKLLSDCRKPWSFFNYPRRCTHYVQITYACWQIILRSIEIFSG